jgi:hypothetical protein
MKKMAQVAVIGALIGLGATGVNAQSSTNADLAVNISLSGVAQTGTGVTRVRIATKDILNALNTGGTNSRSARLLLRFDPTGTNSAVFVIRSGSGSSATETVLDPAVLSVDVAPPPFDTEVTSTTTRGNVNTETSVAIRRFTFNPGTNPSFIVQGYTAATSDNKGLRGGTTDTTTVTKATANVSGTGTTTAGDPAVLQGTISLSGRKIEANID